MSNRFFRCLLVALALSSLASPAVAEERKPAAHAPKRRVEKHSRDGSAQVRQDRVYVIPRVIVVGRPGRPLSVFESSAKPFEFPVGTVRYSPVDRRFLRTGPAERW